jgi:hypothetical protein
MIRAVSFRLAAAVAALTTVAAAGVATTAAGAATDRPNTLAGARSTAPIANNAWVREKIGTSTDQDWYRFDAPGAGQLMATLGNLPANYSLAIYDSAGRLVRSSNQGGAGFERVIWTAPGRGTYFARVDSAGASSYRTYGLRIRTLPNGLSVLSQYAFKMTNGHVSIMAEIRNTTSGWRRITNVFVDLQDKNGRTLATDLTSLSNVTLPPGGVSQINSASVVPAPAGFAKVRIRPASITVPAADANPKLTVHRTSSGKTPAGLPRYRGYVSTTSPTTVTDVAIYVAYYDTWGNIRLTSHYGPQNGTVPAGGTSPYDITMHWAPFYPPPNRITFTAFVARL